MNTDTQLVVERLTELFKGTAISVTSDTVNTILFTNSDTKESHLVFAECEQSNLPIPFFTSEDI